MSLREHWSMQEKITHTTKYNDTFKLCWLHGFKKVNYPA